jgi:hypothetical protein
MVTRSFIKRRLRRRVCRFLDEVARTWGTYQTAELEDEGSRDLLRLCYVKTVDDCRAIAGLSRRGHYIQGATLMRSTHDACYLMMRLLFDPEDTDFLQEWRQGGQLSHWRVVDALNKVSETQIDRESYGRLYDRLNDFVHSNYPALSSYPAQVLGTRAEKLAEREKTSFWEPLLDLCLYSCLMVAGTLSPKGMRARQLQVALGYPASSET